MNLSEIMRVIRRRWYVVLPTVVLAVALTAVVSALVPTKYQSESSIALLNTPLPTDKSLTNGNPFLSFDTSLTATADFLARSLTSDESAKDLKKMGVTEEYTARLADNAMGPFITLTVIGTDKRHVLQSTEQLTSYAEQKLASIQRESGAPAGSFIHSARIVPPQRPQAQLKTKVEAVAGAGGAGLALAFLVTFLTDTLARSRQRKRPRPRADALANRPSDLTAELRIPALRTALDRTVSSDHTVVIPLERNGAGPGERTVALERSTINAATKERSAQPDRTGAAAVYRSRTAPAQRTDTDPVAES